MSRVGNKSIPLPEKVTIKVDSSTVLVEGPKGKLDWTLPEGITLSEEDGAFSVQRADDSRHLRSMHGTARSLIANMVERLTELEKIATEVKLGKQDKVDRVNVKYCNIKLKTLALKVK